MTDDPYKTGADRRAIAELDHETNYAIEVLQREFPKVSGDKIKRAIETAREKLGPSADRWQVMTQARATLSR